MMQSNDLWKEQKKIIKLCNKINSGLICQKYKRKKIDFDFNLNPPFFTSACTVCSLVVYATIASPTTYVHSNKNYIQENK